MKKIYCFLLACASSGPMAFAQSTVYSYTGSPQQYVVPPGCYQGVRVTAYGAQGGGNTSAVGGLGGQIVAYLPAAPGETLYVYVGGQGDPSGTAGYNGGGSGIGGSQSNPGSGGGGASDVRKGGNTLADRWVVAGGGGGATDNGGASNGGAGGGMVGGTGGIGGNPWGCTNLTAATGGSQSAGGLGGTSVSCVWNGFDGGFGLGGNSHNNYRSGGGGGGWYGGGGAHNGASGGGGSSYAHPSAWGVTHSQGFQSGNGLVVLTPISAFSVDLGADTTVCNGLTLDAGHAGSTYSWSTGATTQVVTANTSGTYMVTVDSAACSASDTITVTVVTPPVVNLGSDTSVCSTVTLDAGNGGSSYLWSTGDTVQTLTVGPGTYAVSVTGTPGCTGVDTIMVTGVAPPSVHLGGAATGCDSLTLDAGNPGNSYLWNTGATTQTLTVANNGVYSVTVTEGSCQLTGTDSVLVTLGSTAAASFTGLDSTYCTIDPNATLTGMPGGGIFSGTGVTGNVFSPALAGPGQFTVTYTYTDSLGCLRVATAVTSVNVCPATDAPFPGSLRLYPNPTTGMLVLEGVADATPVRVHNALGQAVHATTATGNRVALDLREAPRGMYLVRVEVDGRWHGQRVLVQ